MNLSVRVCRSIGYDMPAVIWGPSSRPGRPDAYLPNWSLRDSIPHQPLIHIHPEDGLWTKGEQTSAIALQRCPVISGTRRRSTNCCVRCSSSTPKPGVIERQIDEWPVASSDAGSSASNFKAASHGLRVGHRSGSGEWTNDEARNRLLSPPIRRSNTSRTRHATLL